MKFVSWVEKLYEITIINALDEIQTFAPQIKTDGLIFIEIVGLLSQSQLRLFRHFEIFNLKTK